MTGKEMSDEFDLLYDTASNEAPGLDEYEKSVFLTKGMLELSERRHQEYLNKPSRGFHDDEINRDTLKGFIASAVVEYEKTPVISDSRAATEGEVIAGDEVDPDTYDHTKIEPTTDSSRFFKRPLDSMGVLFEDVRLVPKKENPRLKPIRATVIPARYDHIDRLIKSPFTKPFLDRAYRLNHSDIDGFSLSEIIYDDRFEAVSYRLKYIKVPVPIILVDLNATFPGQNLSIESRTKPYVEPGIEEDEDYVSQATNVDNTIHHEIVQRGVELAILHYRENTLQNNLQAKINKRV